MNEWIKDLKIGDKVLTIERHFKWVSEIITIESNYIETAYHRDRNNEEINELIIDLAKNHRSYSKLFVKNYFGIDGNINILEIKNG